MNVLQVITTLGVGGAERHLLALCAGLAGVGWRPRVAYLKGGGELAPAFQRAGIPVHALGAGSWWRRRRALAESIRTGDVALVHSHLLKANLLTESVRPPSIPHVRGVHNDEAWLRRPFAGRVHRMLLRRSAPVVVPTRHVADFLVARGAERAERIAVVPYGVDVVDPETDRRWRAERRAFRAALGVPADAFLVLCLARFARQKGQCAWLRALGRTAVDARVHLLFAGGDPEGREERRFRRVLCRSPWRDRVTLLGPSAEPERLLRQVDLLAIPSRWEGLGLVALEAMEASLPIAASDLPALREVLGESAVGFAALDDGAAWRHLLVRAFEDEARRRAVAAAARLRLLAGYSRARMIERHVALYRELVNGSPLTGAPGARIMGPAT